MENESEKRSADEIRAQAREAGGDMRERAREAVEGAREAGREFRSQAHGLREDLKGRARAAAGSVAENYEHVLESAQSGLHEAQVSVEDYVRAHPWAALGIAVGVGYLISKLTSKD